MPSMWSALALALSMLPGTLAQGYSQILNVIWSEGAFSTTVGDGYNAGVAILDYHTNETIYNGNPAGYSPCGYDGYTFTFTDGGLETPLKLHCVSNFDGSPSNCAVQDANGGDLGYGKGNDEDSFLGFTVISDAYCGTSATLEHGHIDHNSKFHITKD